MLAGMPSLSHEEQQEAVERIHQFMSEGMSSGEAIALVAAEIRERHQNDPQAMPIFEDSDFDDNDESDYRRDNEQDADEIEDTYEG
ncbi:YoaH family protein [Yersinia kristensenii]|uniref:YoaH family protein n=1 Tax=Yersinia kristensenii TaxID=28152 RepID=UPI0011A3167F|nr:YoaH family protein [Yersinia kristensenii]